MTTTERSVLKAYRDAPKINRDEVLSEMSYSADEDADFDDDGFNAACDAIAEHVPVGPRGDRLYLEIDGGTIGGYLDSDGDEWVYNTPESTQSMFAPRKSL